MRVGQNPSKMRGSPAYQPKKVGLASLTYVPALEGYFREALEVIDVHLTALHDSIDQEVDICVFDNGSCPEVISFLQDRWRAGVIRLAESLAPQPGQERRSQLDFLRHAKRIYRLCR